MPCCISFLNVSPYERVVICLPFILLAIILLLLRSLLWINIHFIVQNLININEMVPEVTSGDCRILNSSISQRVNYTCALLITYNPDNILKHYSAFLVLAPLIISTNGMS